ncbi:efflux RND transporter permease subunit [Salinisphaera hydrothermalis]|uniref:Efflux pump membrane transporter n=1 Tax=Salinisphaera hydrothermalis (strain C41B8) TaxID=1304275 RepID=A0A084IHY7_SALHC|nr:efflux RND transporter permease subunit [Salinisphaera hydrothermalis]KEZ76321.1 hydrophobe/amphiphile efflux-1 (HAE1) family transporter [Salinisphaera hydrothermalis C41B8]
MVNFFIDRPIFAWVIAIVVVLGGIISIETLPLEQYPTIAPPSISINATYTGASAKTVEQSVTQVIEQQMTGLNNLLYMTSSSTSQGSAQIQLTFESGTDPDIAQVQVQNKLQSAESRLPSSVQEQGITVTQTSSDIAMVVALYSDDGSMSQADIGDYIASSLADPISRLNGVGNTKTLGSEYAMRIWLNPKKLDKFKLMPSDVSEAVESQNTNVAAGSIGGLPAVPKQQLDATLQARSRLTSAKQFRNIIVKSEADGSEVHLGDVAKVQLGSEDYSVNSTFNGRPAAGLGIELASGANAMAVAKRVKAKLNAMEPFFPKGLKAEVAYDTTPFVKVSIEEVVKTLFEAIALVVAIMFLFLQSPRATLIPTLAVPVVLMGTFGVLSYMDYSINTLTMFGMVLAIGLLVDDAIVVVENVERVMEEQGLSPRDATRQAMSEISGALIGVALVLSAVFVPMAFFGGSTGAIYRQFSVTLVAAMVLSVLVALTLSPALCASLLKPARHDRERGLFGPFNRGLARFTDGYTRSVRYLARHRGWIMLLFVVICAGVALLYTQLSSEFLPTEDQGVLMAEVQLPSGATMQRTRDSISQVETYFEKQPNVKSVMAIAGFSHGGSGQNSGIAFIKLKPWGQRTGSVTSAEAIAAKATRNLSSLRDARVFVESPPAIHGLGSSSGFDLELEDVGGVGRAKLTAARDKFLKLARADNKLAQVRNNGEDSATQLEVDINDAKASALDLDLSDVNSTLSAAFGGTYIDDFIHDGRVKKVYMQAAAPYRMLPGNIGSWYVRNSDDQMVPFSAFASTHWTYGPQSIQRYNGDSAFEINGEPAAGISSSQAMTEVAKLVSKLPAGIGYEWSGISYQEKLSGNQAPLLYGVSVLFVFLCLAALYESWSIPLAVMLVVPLGVLGAVGATLLRGMAGDVYFQVGLLTTVGLSAKNAILIVEYASELERGGLSILDATLRAVRLRLRPILMTSLAFGLGVFPLVISTGAGAAARNSVGTGVFGGMVTATVLGIFFVPIFFVVVRAGWKRRHAIEQPRAE